MKTYTITNDFHDSTARIRAEDGTMLSASTVRRVRRALCGIDGCTCGGVLGQRGRQPVIIDEMAYGEVMIRLPDLD